MPVPDLAVTAAAPESVEADVLVLGVRSTDDGGVLLVPDGSGVAPVDLAAIGVSGAVGDLVRLPAGPAVAAGSLALVGVGRTADPDALRGAAAVAVRRLAGTAHVAIALPVEDDETVAAVLEGAALGAYAYTAYRDRTLAAQKAPVARVTVVGAEDAAAAVHRATAVADAVALVK
ncbi:M17 family peptidase N-terminal domain-containing protein, partial [uncultured Amnibacterium sp.]|uniref:M17 family peptidase N-terminal domain-containing protein n=1 Tax=uncultured Amnibacterium sp. TaxID=1631851 RepID=UPI0035CB1094